MTATPDWSLYSREAVRLMSERNSAWMARFGLATAPFRWDLDAATLAFDRGPDAVAAKICVVGTVFTGDGTFLWSWANPDIPAAARARIGEVRAFGERHDLPLLVEPKWPGGKPQGLELLAISGRILDAEGVFIDGSGELMIFMALLGFEVRPR